MIRMGTLEPSVQGRTSPIGRLPKREHQTDCREARLGVWIVLETGSK